MARHTAAALPEVLRLLTDPVPASAGPGYATLSPVLLHAVQDLVPCDVVVYNDLAPHRAAVCAASDSDGMDDVGEEDGDPFVVEFFARFWPSPAAQPDRTGDFVSVVALSDLCSVREWRQSPMYDLLRTDLAYDRQLMLPLGGTGRHSRRLRLIRVRGPDFDEVDRALLAVLRPHLVSHLQAVELGLRGVRPPTTRQRQVLEMLAVGSSNNEIARRMGISPQTVRTHLQQIYARLGVSNRTEAVATAGSLAPLPRSGRRAVGPSPAHRG